NFLVLPYTESQSPSGARPKREARLDHQAERAFPGYYAITLPESGIRAELTATRRVGVHRYNFAPDAKPRIRIDVTSGLGRGRSQDGQVRVRADANEVEGSVRTFGTFSARYGGLDVYFVARFSQRFAAVQAWQGESLAPDRFTASGGDVGVDLAFRPAAAEPVVELK